MFDNIVKSRGNWNDFFWGGFKVSDRGWELKFNIARKYPKYPKISES